MQLIIIADYCKNCFYFLDKTLQVLIKRLTALLKFVVFFILGALTVKIPAGIILIRTAVELVFGFSLGFLYLKYPLTVIFFLPFTVQPLLGLTRRTVGYYCSLLEFHTVRILPILKLSDWFPKREEKPPRIAYLDEYGRICKPPELLEIHYIEGWYFFIYPLIFFLLTPVFYKFGVRLFRMKYEDTKLRWLKVVGSIPYIIHARQFWDMYLFTAIRKLFVVRFQTFRTPFDGEYVVCYVHPETGMVYAMVAILLGLWGWYLFFWEMYISPRIFAGIWPFVVLYAHYRIFFSKYCFMFFFSIIRGEIQALIIGERPIAIVPLSGWFYLIMPIAAYLLIWIIFFILCKFILKIRFRSDAAVKVLRPLILFWFLFIFYLLYDLFYKIEPCTFLFFIFDYHPTGIIMYVTEKNCIFYTILFFIFFIYHMAVFGKRGLLEEWTAGVFCLPSYILFIGIFFYTLTKIIFWA